MDLILYICIAIICLIDNANIIISKDNIIKIGQVYNRVSTMRRENSINLSKKVVRDTYAKNAK